MRLLLLFVAGAAVLEIVLFRQAPGWLARLSFVPVGKPRVVSVSPAALATLTDETRQEGGYRVAPVRATSLARLRGPGVVNLPCGRMLMHPSRTSAVLVLSRREGADFDLARVELRLDGSTLALRFRAYPMMIMPVLAAAIGMPLGQFGDLVFAVRWYLFLWLALSTAPEALGVLVLGGGYAWIRAHRRMQTVIDPVLHDIVVRLEGGATER